MVQLSQFLLQLVACSNQFVRRTNALRATQTSQLQSNVSLGLLVDEVRMHGLQECTSLRSAGVPEINGLVVGSAPLNWPAHSAAETFLNPSKGLRRRLPNRHNKDVRSTIRSVFFPNRDGALPVEESRSIRTFQVGWHVAPFELLPLTLRQLYLMTAA